MQPASTERRWGRPVARAAVGLVVAAAFLVSLTGGVILHANLPPVRRLARRLVNAVLARQYLGRVELGPIEALEPGLAQIAFFRVQTPSGRQVLSLRGVRIEAALLEGAVGTLLGRPSLWIDLASVSAASVVLQRDEGGRLTLARAFASRHPQREPLPEAQPARRADLQLHLARLDVARLAVGGTLGGQLPIDATVTRLLAAADIAHGRVRLDVDRSSVVERALLGATTRGTTDLHLRATTQSRRIDLWSTFTGQVGELELLLRAAFIDGQLAVSLGLPKVGRRELAPWVPAAPIEQPVSAEARITGSAPLFDLSGEVTLPSMEGAPPGQLTMRGKVRLGPVSLLDTTLRAAAVDLHALRADLPHTRLIARARVRGRLAGAASELRAHIDVGGRLGEVTLPPVAGTVLLAQAASGAWLDTSPAAGTLMAAARYRPARGLAFGVRGALDLGPMAELSRKLGLHAMSSPVRGRASLQALGSIGPEQIDVGARVDVDGVSLPAAGVRVARGQIRARLRGLRTEPDLDLAAHGAGLLVGDADIERFAVTVRGPWSAPRLRATARDRRARDFELAAELDAPGARLRNAHIVVAKDTARLEASLGELSAEAGAPRVIGARLLRVGGTTTKGALSIEGGELTGRLQADDVDLGAIGELLDLPYPLRGHARVDIDIARAASGRRGHARLEITDAGMLVVSGVAADIDTRFDGPAVTGQVRLRMGSGLEGDASRADRCAGVTLAIDLDRGAATVPGPLLSPAGWRRAAASGELRLRQAKLRCLAELWEQLDPTSPIPLERVDGSVDGRVVFRYRPDSAWPTIDTFGFATHGLVLALRKAGDGEAAGWSSEHLDLGVAGRFDPEAGVAAVRLGLRAGARQPSGGGSELAWVAAQVTLDPQLLAARDQQVREAWLDAPLNVELHLPRRSIRAWRAALPSRWVAALDAVRGEVQLDGFTSGSVRNPTAAWRARAWKLQVTETATTALTAAPSIDLDALASYRDGRGRLDGWVGYQGARVLRVEGTLRGNPTARLLGDFDDRWHGNLKLVARQLRLQTIPQMQQLRVSGQIGGTVSVDDLGGRPKLRSDLQLERLAVRGQPILRRARVRLGPGEGPDADVVTLQASLAAAGGGRATVTGYGSLIWRDALVPRPDDKAPAALLVTADAFSMSTLQPLVRQHVTGLDGRLDGALRLTRHELLGHDASIDVDLRLRDGRLHLPAMGQALHDIGAHVSSTRNMIRVDDIHLAGERGQARGWFMVRHDDLTVRDVTGSVTVPRSDPMPLMVEGVHLGTASGTVIVSAQQQADELALAMTVAGLRVRLPPSASRQVQPLDDHPDVHTSAPLGPSSDEPVTRGSRPVHLTLALADAQMAGPAVQLAFATSPAHPIESRGGALGGEIVLATGHFNLLGKVFEIDRGVVRLRQKDPGNPHVALTAHYNAPDGSVIYCDFVGPLRPLSRDKIHFRSQPPRPEHEIIASLLFGDAGADGADGPAGGRASGLGRGLAAAQLNSALAGAAPGLTTGVTSSEGAVRTSLSYQLTDRLSARATYERSSSVAAAASGASEAATADKPQSTANTRFSFDWRVAQHWLLRGSFGVGDEPSSGLDLLFQHRY